MHKSLIGNALFAGCVISWFIYADGDRSLMLAGTILAFGCFLSGIFMGYILRAPRATGRGTYRAPEPPPFVATPAVTDMEEQKYPDSEEAEGSSVAASIAPGMSEHSEVEIEEEMYDLNAPEPADAIAPERDEVEHRNAMEPSA